ncbi:CLC2B protein, partial [Atlantisia rogersi]|nr:CLC2B protein [Atlantisia rogersi]
CPYDWVGHRNVCYYVSKEEEGTWDWSQERCSSLGASLAVLRAEWEEFLTKLKNKVDCWLGLRRQGDRLQWVDGSSYNLSTEVQTKAPCLYLNNRVIVSSSCSQERPYICSKPRVG